MKTEKTLLGKTAAALAALDQIESGMVIGLGTGSTAEIFIQHLAHKIASGLKIKAIGTSTKTEQLASKLGIPLLISDEATEIDLGVDGADAIDKNLVLIKGGGGALLREKILAYSSARFIVIADSSKYGEKLAFPILPVEILPFADLLTIKKLKDLGLEGKIRQKDNVPYVTDNGNFIFDITLKTPLSNPEELDKHLLRIPGVLATGLFFLPALEVILGDEDGTTQRFKKNLNAENAEIHREN